MDFKKKTSIKLKLGFENIQFVGDSINPIETKLPLKGPKQLAINHGKMGLNPCFTPGFISIRITPIFLVGASLTFFKNFSPFFNDLKQRFHHGKKKKHWKIGLMRLKNLLKKSST